MLFIRLRSIYKSAESLPPPQIGLMAYLIDKKQFVNKNFICIFLIKKRLSNWHISVIYKKLINSA